MNYIIAIILKSGLDLFPYLNILSQGFTRAEGKVSPPIISPGPVSPFHPYPNRTL